MSLTQNKRSLGFLPEQQMRLEKLHQPHVEPLTQYLEDMRARHPEKNIPFFDPSDGGVNARALFLMFAVGPKPMCSPFLSVDNTDGTADNFRALFHHAGIAREDILLWNIVPWYLGADSRGKREIKSQDVAQGLEYLKELLLVPQLNQLEVIVLLGRQTYPYGDQIQRFRDLPMVRSAHPSPTALNCHAGKRAATQAQFEEVACYIHK